MRSSIFAIVSLLLISFGAHAQTTMQSFTWERNARFALTYTSKSGRSDVLRGELRDGARQSYQSKDLQTTAEIKSYTTELFVVIAITSEGDDTGSIYLLERPVEEWLIMNRNPIRARKIDIMNDFETAVKDFKATTDHTFANIIRKIVEYFEKNPTKRLQDLLAGLENKDETLRTIPRPRTGTRNGNQGVVPGEVPSDGSRPTVPGSGNPPPQLGDDDGYNRPSRPRRQVEPADPFDNPRPPAYVPNDDDNVARERERQRRQREQRRRQQSQDPAGTPPPYYPSDRGPQDIRPGYQTPGYNQPPRYREPQYQRPQYAPPQYAPPQYAPPQYQQPRRERGFFESIFGQ